MAGHVPDFGARASEAGLLPGALEDSGLRLSQQQAVAGPLRGGTKLYKLRVRRQNRELRPHLCRGPFADHEYTLLQGAIEVGDRRLDPPNAEDRAIHNREMLIRNPNWREPY